MTNITQYEEDFAAPKEPDNPLIAKSTYQLKKEVSAIYEELNRRDALEKDAKNQAIVGKCYKFKNSYGGSTKAEQWWLYFRAHSVKGGCISGHMFQIDYMGRIEIDTQAIRSDLASYKEIEDDEYEEAWAGLLAKVTL